MMTQHSTIKKSESWKMFDKIAPTYDLLNDILSCGILSYWRAKVVKAIPKKKDMTLLDCATGTGEMLFSIMKKRHFFIKKIIGMDLAQEMMNRGEVTKKKFPYHENISFVRASGTAIPAEDNTFDCVTISFGIRNVDDTEACLKELHRVTKVGGKTLILEFSLPTNKFIKELYLFYFRSILPRIGGLISGQKDAYVYLNQTVEDFPYGNDFKNLMTKAGFSVEFQVLTFGIATLYTGTKS